jgi:DNA-damage-inducible protein D
MIELGSGGQKVENHFVGADQMVEIGSGAPRSRTTGLMSRYACYLVIQNADFVLRAILSP